ncbi:MAG: efflux RND transporter periplasmic adaptor subunit [Clostridiales bacterium]|nr:efflux RND transporter periplasmic adaptor subunit [Clostridiales bacterium]
MKKRRFLALASALLLGLNGTGCSSAAGESAASVQSVAMLMGVDLTGTSQYSGIVEAKATVKVQKDSSKTVDEVYVQAGDMVQAGDLLFTYDTDALELSVETAELEVEQLQNSITNYETQIAALEKEKKKASSSDQLSYTLQIQETELNKSEAEYNLKTKQAELERLKDGMGETEVYAEVSGLVQSVADDSSSEYAYSYDDYGSGSGDAFITIMETGTYRIRGTVSEENIYSLYEGMEITAVSRTDSTQTWTGTIESIDTGTTADDSESDYYYDSSSSDSRSAKYTFYVALDSSDGLLIGQHVYLKAGGDESGDEIVLPAGYLVLEGEDASVWAADSNSQLELRSVTLGDYDAGADTYVITDGLTLEDYIAYPDSSLTVGMAVTEYDDGTFETVVSDDSADVEYGEDEYEEGGYDEDYVEYDEDYDEDYDEYDEDYAEYDEDYAEDYDGDYTEDDAGEDVTVAVEEG